MIGIIYPQPGDSVCNIYVAWGGSDTGLPVQGGMALGPFVIQGITIQNPGQNTPWEIQFTNVPNGQGYTLYVEDIGGNGAECTNITVCPQACLQQQPMPPGDGDD